MTTNFLNQKFIIHIFLVCLCIKIKNKEKQLLLQFPGEPFMLKKSDQGAEWALTENQWFAGVYIYLFTKEQKEKQKLLLLGNKLVQSGTTIDTVKKKALMGQFIQVRGDLLLAIHSSVQERQHESMEGEWIKLIFFIPFL